MSNEKEIRLEGCMVCGRELQYLTEPVKAVCSYCGRPMETHIRCPEGHVVCDDCHRQDSLKAIESICLQSDSRDPVALALEIMRLPFVPMHGPEHHAMVPAVLVAAYRNVTREAGDAGNVGNVGNVGDRVIREALRRGSETPGGACGRLGACGSAVGAGVAWSVISRATPLSVRERGQALALTARALEAVSKHNGPRCCKRDSLTAIQVAMDGIEQLTGVNFERTVNPDRACEHYARNRQCIRLRCPYFPGHLPASTHGRSAPEPVGAGKETDCGCGDGGDDHCQC